jgi:hypothetical protein
MEVYRPSVEKLVLRDYAIRIVRLRYLRLLWRVKLFPDSGGVPMPGLTVKDLEKLQVQHPDYRMELVGGEIVVMSPSGYESDEVAAEIIRLLGNWVRPRRLGRVTASNAGFILPMLIRTCVLLMPPLCEQSDCGEQQETMLS